MKTPRDILFARHHAAAPKLDAIRREIVNVAADVNRRRQPIREFTFAATFAKAVAIPFQELIWPCRRIWTGLAAVWILIFIVNVSQRDGSQTMMAKSASPEMMMTFRYQQKWLDELLADRSPPMDAGRPRIYSPKPRTETMELLTA